VFAEKTQKFEERFVGKRRSVLWEESEFDDAKQQWRLSGMTGNNLRVHALAQMNLWNQINEVSIEGKENNALWGKIL